MKLSVDIKGFIFYHRKDIQNEYRKNFKSAFRSEKENFGFEQTNKDRVDSKIVESNHSSYDPAWYKEALELRKKAGEYRVRNFQFYHKTFLFIHWTFLCIAESRLEGRCWNSSRIIQQA